MRRSCTWPVLGATGLFQISGAQSGGGGVRGILGWTGLQVVYK